MVSFHQEGSNSNQHLLKAHHIPGSMLNTLYILPLILPLYLIEQVSGG